MDSDLSVALSFVLLSGLLLAWLVDAVRERRREVRECDARAGHRWRYGYVFDEPTLPHRWCTRCPAESLCRPDEIERVRRVP